MRVSKGVDDAAGKGRRRLEVGGSFGVDVEQLRNGGCLWLLSSYRTSRGSKHEPSFLGWAGISGQRGWTATPPPHKKRKPQPSRWTEIPLIGSRPRRAKGRGSRARKHQSRPAVTSSGALPAETISSSPSRSQWSDITDYLKTLCS